MRGYRAAGGDPADSKWFHVNQLMREKRIGILLVQESHLTEERKDDIEKLFGNRLKLYISMDPDSPSARGGVAVALNRSLTNVEGVKVTEVVAGRALLVQSNWHLEEKISVLVVYAPNVTSSDGRENASFWERVSTFFANRPNLKVDILTGDFNVVEDLVDRLPMRSDPLVATAALKELTSRLGLLDGWREIFPSTKAYSFLHSSNGTQSRIDRIYCTPEVLATARDWRIEPTGVPNADHSLVSVQVAHQAAPSVGKGRWSIPEHVIKDKTLRTFAHESGLRATEDMERLVGRPRRDDHNPQLIFHSWKVGVLEMAKERDKLIIPLIKAKIKELEDNLAKVNSDFSQPEAVRCKASADVEGKIRNLERQRHLNARHQSSLRNRLEGETICKYWTQSNKAAKPRDLIYALKKTDRQQADPVESVPLVGHPRPEQQYEKDSEKMAELGRDYHDDLQRQGNSADPDSRRRTTASVLGGLSNETTESQKRELNAFVTREEVAEALRQSKNGTAAGIDGATYELWKALDNRFKEDKRLQKSAFDVVGLMTAAFVDIQKHGVVASTNFAEGWMCPLYKKGERTDIANYRPITCLNTDYKVFTKTLATRLAGDHDQRAPELFLEGNERGTTG
ncbi:Endonuclease/exonuclease/phosphatase [Lyophyllum atratum]|nr:Endonuclease/exonuclease/phosphatase [Lyophyllum atratum]